MYPIQLIAIAVVGGVASHMYAKKKLAELHRDMLQRHVLSMTALADAAVEVMCVDYNAPLKEAMERLYKTALAKNPRLIGLSNPTPIAGAQEHIDNLRKEKYGIKKPD